MACSLCVRVYDDDHSRSGSRELPQIALSASEYGLGDQPLLVRAASDPRQFAVAASSFGVGAVTPSSSEHAARAFVEDLLQRGSVEIPQMAGHMHAAVLGRRLKTHKLVRTEKGLELQRRLFDCGFRSML